MIYNSPNLVLTADQFTLNHPLIGYQNLVVIGNVAASSQDVDFPVSNLANPATYLKWKSEDTDDQEIIVTLDGSEEIDYVGIASHNFGDLSAKITIEIATELDSDGNPEWEEAVPQFIPSNDHIIARFTLGNYIAVRILIEDFENPDDVVAEAAVLYVGKLLVMQRKLYVGHAPITMNIQRNVTNGRSESGQFLGRIILGEKNGTSASFTNLTPTWVRQYVVPFIETSSEEPFFFAWRPETYPNEVGFVSLTSDISPVNALPNGMMSLDLQMSGVVAQ